MDYVILAFAVTSPIAAAIAMAYARRERALVYISDFRSFASQIYIAHSLWDWSEDGGREQSDLDLRAHSDAVMAQIVGIGDELARFLTLPTTSRSIHRMTKQGKREAAQTVEVAYLLLESMTRRFTRLAVYGERIKAAGLPSGEVSRIRQYERFMEDCVERLRMIKMYRTPQAFRSFARIFTFFLPPFYAPTYAEVGINLQSLGMGISYGIVTALGLTALFESLQVLEDPFVGFLALDGIDVREEFQVLLWTSLVNKRSDIFPDAPPYPVKRRRALADGGQIGDARTTGDTKSGYYSPSSTMALASRHHQQAEEVDEDIGSEASSSLTSGFFGFHSRPGTAHGTYRVEEEGDDHPDSSEAVEFGDLIDDDEGSEHGGIGSGDSTVVSGVRESTFKRQTSPTQQSKRKLVTVPSAKSIVRPTHRRTKTIP